MAVSIKISISKTYPKISSESNQTNFIPGQRERGIKLSVSSQNVTVPDKFRVLWQQNCTYLITIKYLYNPLKKHDPHL